MTRAFCESRADWSSPDGQHHLARTANNFVSHACARVAEGFLQDCSVRGLLNPEHPVWVLELGSASGRFGYGVWRSLNESLKLSFAQPPQLKLLLTDSAEWSRSFWRHHFRLTDLFESGS